MEVNMLFIEKASGYIPDDGLSPVFAISDDEKIPAYKVDFYTDDKEKHTKYLVAIDENHFSTVPLDENKYCFKILEDNFDYDEWCQMLGILPF
jgi:hypothetical protein